MKILCAQCGRESEVPDTRAGTMFKCQCKFSFRVPKTGIQSTDSSSEPVTLGGKSSNFDEFEPIEEDSNISDGDMDQYLSSLNRMKSDIKKEEEGQKKKNFEEVKIPSMHDEPIEVNESKRRVEAKVEPEDEPTLEESIETEQEPSFKPAYERTSPGQSPSELEELKDKAVEFIRSPMGIATVSGLGLFLFVLVIVSLVTGGNDEQITAEIDDPILKELLEDQGEPVAKKEKSETFTKKIDVASSKKNLKTKNKTTQSRKKAKASRYSQALSAMYQGQFSKVRSLGKSKNSKLGVKALSMEATFLDPKSSAQEISKAKLRLESLMKKNPSSTILIRTEATSFLSDRRSKASARLALKRLDSLALTRSTDPLVFAYIGLAFEQAGSKTRAVQNLSQALTLKRDFPWASKRKDRLARLLQAEKSQ